MAEKHYIKNKNMITWREINPELYSIVYKWKKDDETNAWFLQMTADIMLRGLDFDFVKQYENSSDECKTMDYKIERDSTTEYEGYLDLRGEYRNSGKLFISKIIEIEKIECLFRDTEINLFDYAIDRFSCKPYLGFLEFAEYSYYHEANYITGEMKYEADKWTKIEESKIKHIIHADNSERNYTYIKWVREAYYGSYTMPDGNGWIQTGTDRWARAVTVTKNEISETNVNIGSYNEKIYKESWSYLPAVTLTNGIALREVLFNIFDECLYTLGSQFFRDEVTLDNEVYNTVSDLFHDIKLFHISDVIYADEIGNATNMKVTKSTFIKELLKWFNLELWKSEGIVNIEHKSFRERILNYDITSSEYYTDKYKYKTDLAKSEEWIHTEGARNDNFKSVKIEYSKNCVREINRAEMSESFSVLFADLGSVISNKDIWENDDIDKATIVMVSVDKNGVINRNDTILEKNVMNGCLSFNYLINHLLNYDRKVKTGTVGDFTINNKITSSGKQNDIKFPIEIQDFLTLTPYNYIKTSNGIAMITELEYQNGYCSINYELI